MTFFTPITDGELGRAAAINSRLAEVEAAVLAQAGSLVSLIVPTTLTATAPSITMDLAVTSHPVLIMQLNLRTDRTSGNGFDNVRLTINDDGVSTYTCNYVSVNITAVTGVSNGAVTGCELGYAASESSGNTVNGFAEVRISQANALTAKAGTYQASPGAYLLASGGLYYPGTALIVRLKLVPVFGTVFQAGSTYALYGTN